MVKHDVMFVAEAYLKKKGSLKGERLSNGWWDKFLLRNRTPRLVSVIQLLVSGLMQSIQLTLTITLNYFKIHKLALQIIQRLYLI